MKKKPAYDHSRQEKEPPRVPEPWAIVKGTKSPFTLMNGKIVMKHCLSMSENGAHREGMVFIKEMDF